MSFKSLAQLEWMKENRPDLYDELMSKTKPKDLKKLPERLHEKAQVKYTSKDKSPKKKK